MLELHAQLSGRAVESEIIDDWGMYMSVFKSGREAERSDLS